MSDLSPLKRKADAAEDEVVAQDPKRPRHDASPIETDPSCDEASASSASGSSITEALSASYPSPPSNQFGDDLFSPAAAGPSLSSELAALSEASLADSALSPLTFELTPVFDTELNEQSSQEGWGHIVGAYYQALVGLDQIEAGEVPFTSLLERPLTVHGFPLAAFDPPADSAEHESTFLDALHQDADGPGDVEIDVSDVSSEASDITGDDEILDESESDSDYEGEWMSDAGYEPSADESWPYGDYLGLFLPEVDIVSEGAECGICTRTIAIGCRMGWKCRSVCKQFVACTECMWHHVKACRNSLPPLRRKVTCPGCRGDIDPLSIRMRYGQFKSNRQRVSTMFANLLGAQYWTEATTPRERRRLTTAYLSRNPDDDEHFLHAGIEQYAERVLSDLCEALYEDLLEENGMEDELEALRLQAAAQAGL